MITSNQNEDYVYFVAETPGFSPFAITGTADETGKQTDTSFSLPDGAETSLAPSDSDDMTQSTQKSSPGFELASVITVFALTSLAMKRRS
ncbi:MAG: hypothetical protein SCH66_10135 [Methanolobus sp.]|nr:hypothetical protein [Methanolobus sp.]